MVILYKKNTSGYRGVSKCPITNKWLARIYVNGKTINLGRYLNIEDAAKAYKDATEKYGKQSNLIEDTRTENEKQQEYRKRIPEKVKAWKRKGYIKLKKEIVSAYGGCCVLCKEKEWKFLSIDHINGGGCKHIKEVGDFYYWLKRNNFPKDGFRLLCFNCNNIVYLERIKQKEESYNIKEEVFKEYGGKCECCQNTDLRCLCIDHINNDGNIKRKAGEHKLGHHMYRWLKYNNYPKDEFRLLCYNCNFARHHNNGICPHKEIVK